MEKATVANIIATKATNSARLILISTGEGDATGLLHKKRRN
jgi:hypothetical protein